MGACQPLTGTEQALAEVWSSLLGMQPTQLNAQDNYFDLGGDSLTAMQAVIRMYERTGKRVNANFLIYESLGQIGQRYDALAVDTTDVAKPDEKAGLVKRLFGGLGRSKSLH
jgi:aryl carrier-like protein